MPPRGPVIIAWEGMEVCLPNKNSAKIKAALMRLNERSPKPLFRLKNGKIHAAEVVGCVQIHNLRINILPKTDSENIDEHAGFLLNILQKAGYFRRLYQSTGQVTLINRDPLEWIISEIVASISSAIAEGVPRRYELQSDWLPTVRGKIDFIALSKSGQKCNGQIPVQFKTLSKDNTFSRCIKAVCQNLQKLTRTEANHRSLARILAEFEFVKGRLCSIAELESVQLSDMERHWQETLELVKLLLREKAFNPTLSGTHSAFCLLFSMETVYEKALDKILSEVAYGFDISIPKQTLGIHLLEDRGGNGVLRLRPDYIFSASQNPIAIGDAKWKRVSEFARANGIDRNDLYQITAYLVRYQVRTAMIFAPKKAWMPPNWNCEYKLQNMIASIHVIGVDIVALVSEHREVRETAKQELKFLLMKILGYGN